MVYFVFRSLSAFLVSLLSGILIDVDHILDYYIERGVTLKIKNVYLWCMEKNFKMVFLVFHSLELLFMLWIGISVFKLGIFWTAIAIGITQHMILDIFFNKNVLYAYSYFLSFRIIKGLRRERICRQFQCPTLEK